MALRRTAWSGLQTLPSLYSGSWKRFGLTAPMRRPRDSAYFQLAVVIDPVPGDVDRDRGADAGESVHLRRRRPASRTGRGALPSAGRQRSACPCRRSPTKGSPPSGRAAVSSTAITESRPRGHARRLLLRTLVSSALAVDSKALLLVSRAPGAPVPQGAPGAGMLTRSRSRRCSPSRTPAAVREGLRRGRAS